MLLSAAAMTPLRLVGGGFDDSSSSSTPVEASTASTTCPVLLVHGFAGTTSSWSLVARTLSARGLTVEAMSYPPLGTSVEQLAERLVAEVERILCRTGADKVHLVGHSLGGVVIAQAVADRRLRGWLARSSPWARRSAGRHGRVCCRLSRSSGRCDRVRRCCAGSPPRQCLTECGGCQ